jgi:hypothetical protein
MLVIEHPWIYTKTWVFKVWQIGDDTIMLTNGAGLVMCSCGEPQPCIHSKALSEHINERCKEYERTTKR